jgi:hypothetical protein
MVRETIGTVVERGGSNFAFDADGTLIGEYATRIEAVGTPSRACASSSTETPQPVRPGHGLKEYV